MQKIHIKLLSLLTLVLLAILSWSFKDEWILNPQLRGDVPTVQVDNDWSKAVYLDCRSPEEYNVSCIPHAQYFNGSISNNTHLKNDTIIVYCSLGMRSESLVRELRQAGFKHVDNLSGGIFRWKNIGRSIVDAAGNETERLHAYSHFWGLWIEEAEKVYTVE